MTGTVKETYSNAGVVQGVLPSGGTYKKILDWTADSNGSVDFTCAVGVVGALDRCVTIPSTVVVPTDNYDITVKDENAIDILNSEGLNRSATVTQEVFTTTVSNDNVNTFVLRSLSDLLTLNVANAGNGGKGKVVLYFKA